MSFKTVKARKTHSCAGCRKPILSGTLCSLESITVGGEDWVHKYRQYWHLKCKYYAAQSEQRKAAWTPTCSHPPQFVATAYTYIPGECVKEPSHDYCSLCGAEPI